MTRRIALAFFVLFFALPAQAVFTDGEKAEIHKLWLANDDLARGAYDLELSVYLGETTGVNTSAVVAVNYAAGELWYAIGYLANVDMLFVNPPDRATYVSRAMQRLNFSINSFAQAVAALPPPDSSNTNRAAQAAYFFQSAHDLLASFDQTLPYTDPFPITSQGFPRQFGPHGNWPLAEDALVRPISSVWTQYRDIMLGMQTHTKEYGFAWRIKQFAQRASNAFFAGWAHDGSFGPSEATMRALVATVSPDAASFDLETTVGFYEIQSVHEQEGETGATHHFPYLAAEAMECGNTCDGSIVPVYTVLNAVKNIVFAWRKFDGWVQEFTAISEPIPAGPGSCTADLNRDGAVDELDAAILTAHLGDSCASHTASECDGADLNLDGTVDDADLSIFKGCYGSPVCPARSRKTR